MPFMPPWFFLFLLCPCNTIKLPVDCNMSSLQSNIMKSGSFDKALLYYYFDFDEMMNFF
jgi:hypothetical protein